VKGSWFKVTRGIALKAKGLDEKEKAAEFSGVEVVLKRDVYHKASR